MESKDNNIKKVYIYIALGALLLLAFLAMDKVVSVLSFIIGVTSPFLVGIIVASLVNVPLKYIEHKIFTKGSKGFRRIISLITTLFVVILILTALLFIVIPQLSSAFSKVVVKLPPLIEKWTDELSSFSFSLPSWLSFIDIDLASIEGNVINTIKSWGSIVVNSSVAIAQTLVQSVITISLALVFAIYMLLKKETLFRHLQSLIKAYTSEYQFKKIIHTGQIVNHTFSKFISTTALEALILGGMFLITMLIFRLPYPFLIASIVSVAAFIPIVGAFVAAFVGILLMLVNVPIDALWFLILFLVLQQIEGNIIYPRVVGDSLGLPGIWVLFSVLVGGSLFGIVGIFLGVPFAAIAYALIREEVKKRLEEQTS
ncbi:MAG: AI-2E family transporter [Spirochaetia bacterium]|nr:AI-2E family transporter [Spirochaetia bacterium]